MKKYTLFSYLMMTIVLLFACSPENGRKDNLDKSAMQFWLTDPGKGIKFTSQTTGFNPGEVNSGEAINILLDSGQIHQEMDGFGFALTGGSALQLSLMSLEARTALIQECFGTGSGDIGISYLRVSIGASDLDEYVFSYNDLETGQTDTAMEHFTLDEDRRYLIPMLKEILEVAPDIKILGSPWSAPVWMKTNQFSIGGSLKSEFHRAYAKYFVKYIQGMAAEGITIDAITIQNEPLHPGNNPSMYMTASQQANFIKNDLGPAFEAAGLETKIIIWDHNADVIEYPLEILNDPEAKKYVDGSAFHLYGGDINALSDVHNVHPDKNLYFTEQWIGAPGNFREDLKWHHRNLFIGAVRNWCRNVLQWNFAADPNQDPHTDGGCSLCLGGLTIDGDDVVRNPAYYNVAHSSKFVRPGSYRIGSTVSSTLPNVAYVTPDGSVVIIVLNDTDNKQSFNLVLGDRIANSSLSPGAVGTYVWNE